MDREEAEEVALDAATPGAAPLQFVTDVRDGYLYVRVTGDYSLQGARDACRHWMDSGLAHLHRSVIADIRGVRNFRASTVAVMQRFELAQGLVQVLPPDIRLAIVESDEQFDPERFGELVMSNRGMMVRITTSLDDALAWIGTWRDSHAAAPATEER